MANRQDNRCGSPDPLIEVLPPCNYKHVDDEVDHHLNEVLISRSIDDSEKYRDPSEINPDPILLLSGVEAGELDVDVPLVCDSKSWIYSSLLEGCGDNGVFYPYEDRTVIPSLAGLRISDDGPDSVKLVSEKETLVDMRKLSLLSQLLLNARLLRLVILLTWEWRNLLLVNLWSFVAL